jgi:hypothetical protein
MTKKIKKAQNGTKVKEEPSFLREWWSNFNVSEYNTPTFNEAFRKARNNGDKEFLWIGKKYSTKLISKDLDKNYKDSKKYLDEFISQEPLSLSREDSIKSNRDTSVMKALTEQYKSQLKKNLAAPIYTSITEQNTPGFDDGYYQFDDTKKGYEKLFIGSGDTTPVHELAHKAGYITNVNDEKHLEQIMISRWEAGEMEKKSNLVDGDTFGYIVNPRERAARHISTKKFLKDKGFDKIDEKSYSYLLDLNKKYTEKFNSLYNDSKSTSGEQKDVKIKAHKEVNLPYDVNQLIQLYGTKEEFIKQLNTPLGVSKDQSYKNGGVIKDNRGQWAHPGKVTQIDSNNITMKGVDYPVLGVSDIGDTKLMLPGQDYKFNGNNVTEFPMMQKGGKINKSRIIPKRISTGEIMDSRQEAVNHLYRQGVMNPDTVLNYLNYMQDGTKVDDFTPREVNKYLKTIKVKEQKQSIPFDSIPNTQNLNLKEGGNLYNMKKGQNGLQPIPSPQMQLDDILLKNALLQERTQKRDSVRTSLKKQFPGETQYDMINQGMLKYYTKEPLEYSSLDIKLLDDKRRKSIMETYNFNKNFKSGGKIKKAQYGFSMSDINPTDAAPIELDSNVQNPYIQGLGSESVPYNAPQRNQSNFFNRMGGMSTVMQGANAVNYGFNSPGSQQDGGPSEGQKIVGQFGPWGQLISQVSQIGTRIGDEVGGDVGGAISGMANPSAALTNKDLSATDRVVGAIVPFYGGIKASRAKQARKDKQNKLDELVKKAAGLQDPDANRRRYVRPEDQLVDPGEMFPSYGVGTSYLKNGGHVPQMNNSGELKTFEGGDVETISENPFLPDAGETVMFRGDSHAKGGIEMKFGKTSVEVEGGEPAVKLPDGQRESLVVFGDMKIPSYGVSELNDPKAKGKKFKNYINDLSKEENKQNKVVEKGVKLVNDTPLIDSFDKLKVSSGKAMMEGGNMKLKTIAGKKQIAANVQNAILETADELGLKSNELARGKFQKEKKSNKTAQEGMTIPRSRMSEYEQYGYMADPQDVNRMYRDLQFSGNTQNIPATPPGQGSEEFNTAFGQARRQNLQEFDWKGKKYTTDLFQERTQTVTNPGRTERDYIYLEDDPITQMEQNVEQNVAKTEIPNATNPNKNRTDWIGLANSLIPMFRPSNQRTLDPNQLSGEMFAMASNQQEPVQAQLYQPLLENVSDISLQDQMNANQADFNSIQRLTASNPAAQASLAAQKYQANSQVLGEQFRLNQNQRTGVYNRNRGVLNDATLKNLGILDQQYVRQSTAKSNTKAVAQAAINSISDKIARNKLENRTLGIYENLYNYRYDNSGRAWNMNQIPQFITDSGVINVDKDGRVVMDETKVKRDKNGMIINSTETQRVTGNMRNGGVVKAIKSL